MTSVLHVALVWLLVLVAVPLGSAPLERVASEDGCASWCPCEDLGEAEHEAEHEDDCEDECEGCCDARAPVALGSEPLPSSPSIAVSTAVSPSFDAPGCRVDTGVFRPPQSLT